MEGWIGMAAPALRMVAGMGSGRIRAALGRRFGRAGRDRGERGAVLVEAAIVIPILMMITLGIIEYGGAYREDSAVAAAARSGARVASSLPKTDFGICSSSCTDSGATVAGAVSAALQSFGANAPQVMYIYKVGASGNTPPFTSCTYCVGYNWNSATKQFTTSTKLGPGWAGTKQNACATSPPGPDQIGIWVKVNHQSVTKMFGGNRSLTATTIMRLEPYVGTLACASS
jgi:Flp pilus assembly protein TadG